MALVTKGIFIVGAKRTPFCKYGGSFKDLPASHAFAAAAKEALRSANVNPNLVDTTIVGNVNFLSQCDGGKTSRYCGLYSGVPIERPALGVNKACGSGIQSVINGAVDILTSLAKVTLTGGTENMSSLPFLVRNVRFGTQLGSTYKFDEYTKQQELDTFSSKTIYELAEIVANKYGLGRDSLDTFAFESRLKYQKAKQGLLKHEIAPVNVMKKKTEITINEDEIDDTESNLGELHSATENGRLITKGNSYAIADGAAAILLANEESLRDHNLAPLVRVSGWACVGVNPLDTGMGAILATKKLLDITKKDVKEVEIFEVNETFASHALAFAKEFKIDTSNINTNGGALSMGHPVAATGARMVTHLVHEMSRRGLKTGIAASSCGGGQGIALMVEGI